MPRIKEGQKDQVQQDTRQRLLLVAAIEFSHAGYSVVNVSFLRRHSMSWSVKDPCTKGNLNEQGNGHTPSSPAYKLASGKRIIFISAIARPVLKMDWHSPDQDWSAAPLRNHTPKELPVKGILFLYN